MGGSPLYCVCCVYDLFCITVNLSPLGEYMLGSYINYVAYLGGYGTNGNVVQLEASGTYTVSTLYENLDLRE